MLVMIAGPYRGETKSEEDRQKNLDRLNKAAVDVFKKGHTPIIGVNQALPMIAIDGEGESSYQKIMSPVSNGLAQYCDAILKLPGESTGADQEVEIVKNGGGTVYHSLDQIPQASSHQTKFRGMIVEESLLDPSVMNHLSIESIQITNPGGWHIYAVVFSEDQINQCQQWIKDGPWYMHFWRGDEIVAVFKDKTFRFSMTNRSTWKPVIIHGQAMGIPAAQLDFLVDKS